MDIDYGRKQDLADLAQGIKEARNMGEKEYLERIAYRVINESTTIKSLRHELIAATRVGDISKVKRVQHHINKVRQEETDGQSWGHNRGEVKLV